MNNPKCMMCGYVFLGDKSEHKCPDPAELFAAKEEMPDETKPLSASEIEAIGAHLSNADIALPKADMVSTQELGRVLESAVAFEQCLFATIRDLQAEVEHSQRVKKALQDTLSDHAERAEKAEAENKRLTEKLEAIASVPFEPFSAAIAKAATATSEGE